MTRSPFAPLVTPDGRYVVVRGRLWRRANPNLSPEESHDLVAALMAARRAVGAALRHGDGEALAGARAAVHAAKVALGERGPPWWDDGAPDQNRRMARNSTYAGWYPKVEQGGVRGAARRDDRNVRPTGKRLPTLGALALSVAGCAWTPPHRALAAASPTYAPQAFFAGRTIGVGVLRVGMERRRAVHVVGDGGIEPDGTLVLAQRVEQAGKNPRLRTWRLRQRADGRLDVSLSDATGQVKAEVRGNLLHVRFAMRGGLGVEQWLYLEPDGRSALNRMVVRKFGLPVATLRETIRREG